MKNEKVKEKWGIVEVSVTGVERYLGVEYTSIEKAGEVVRNLNKKATVQTTFYIKDVTNET